MCHKVRVRATQATTKIALFLSKCIVAVSKCLIIVHAFVAFGTVAIISVSQHHVTPVWLHTTHVDYTPILYLNTHTVFPWIIIVVISVVLTTLDVVVLNTLLYLKKKFFCKQKKKTVKYQAAVEKQDKPPRTHEYKIRKPQSKQKQRLYPTIQSLKIYNT